MISVECYIVVKATLNGEGENAWTRGRTGLRVTKNKPALERNEVPIKLNLELPVVLFQRPSLQANITVPAGHPLSSEITADVQDNVAEAIRQATGMEVSITVRGEE
jgi:hypothetical protein